MSALLDAPPPHAVPSRNPPAQHVKEPHALETVQRSPNSIKISIWNDSIDPVSFNVRRR
jgi:hypothetical protein